MAIDFLYPQYEVVRNYDRCICCPALRAAGAPTRCIFTIPEFQKMDVDESKCVACHRMRVPLPDTRAQDRQDQPHL